MLKPVEKKLSPFAINFQNYIESTQLIDNVDRWVRFYLTETLSQAVSLIVLFSETFFSMLQVYNVYKFLIINSGINLSFGLLRLN